MTAGDSQSDRAQGPPVSEEELHRRLAEEMKKIQVRDVLLQTVVSLVNLGGQRLGLTEDTKDARDLEQTRLAIEAVRVLVPLLEENAPKESPEQLVPVRDALAQLQVAYAREAAAGEKGSEGGAEPEQGKRAESEPGRAQPTGTSEQRGTGGLWVPPGSDT